MENDRPKGRPAGTFTSRHRFRGIIDASHFINKICESICFNIEKYTTGPEAYISDTNEVTFTVSPFLLNLLDRERGRKPRAVLTFDVGSTMTHSNVELFLTMGEAQARMIQHFKQITEKKSYIENEKTKYYHILNDHRTRILIINKKTGKVKYRWQIYFANNKSYRYGDGDNLPSTGIIIKGYRGYWNIVEEKIINGQMIYLIENNFPKIEAPRLVINKYKDILIEDVREETLNQILKEEKEDKYVRYDSILDEPDDDLELIDLVQKQELKKEKGYE